MTVTVLGTRALPKPADKPPLDHLIVGVGVFSSEILAHPLHARSKRSSVRRNVRAGFDVTAMREL